MSARLKPGAGSRHAMIDVRIFDIWPK